MTKERDSSLIQKLILADFNAMISDSKTSWSTLPNSDKLAKLSCNRYLFFEIKPEDVTKNNVNKILMAKRKLDKLCDEWDKYCKSNNLDFNSLK